MSRQRVKQILGIVCFIAGVSAFVFGIFVGFKVAASTWTERPTTESGT